MQYKYLFWISLFCCFLSEEIFSQNTSHLSGTVEDAKGNPIYGAVVLIEEFDEAAVTGIDGTFSLQGDFSGTAVMEISFLGFKTIQKQINFEAPVPPLEIVLVEDTESLDEVLLTVKSELKQIEALAYNVEVVDAEKLHHTTLDLSQALNRASGVKVRRSGGVGSEMNISLNGFTGSQVKVFIDGIPMENFGSAFQLNNIPINLAKRIEVYKGVVPIGLGADALGGAINIVTNKYPESHLEASYSYGSFNTHRSTINAIYVADSGFTAQLNAFQNYSDNDYKVTVDAADLLTGEYYPNSRLRRFHDTYHNETVIANVGVLNKKYADKLLLGIVLGQKYDEIQTGARLSAVFGGIYTEGTTIMPTLKYRKTDFLTPGLDVTLNANYNFGEEKVIDTLNRRYNWFGDFIEYPGPGGERNYSLYTYKNNNAIVTARAEYAFKEKHQFSINTAFTSFNRVGKDKLEPENVIYQHPKKTYKNIIGVGYKYEEENWSSSVFVKHYTQVNTFADSYNPTGNYGDIAYNIRENRLNDFGYGITGTYFINDNFQIKASYEKTYRLPSAEELFGNVVTLVGNIDLDPETSHNYNLGASYFTSFNKIHEISLNGNVFYRNAKDFIRPRLTPHDAFIVNDNLYNVENLGFSGEVMYSFKNALIIGGNLTYQNLRNNNKYAQGQTVESILYKARVPNMPYFYGNVDATYNFLNPLKKEHKMSVGYDMLYVHSFYLRWALGETGKLTIPEQISHNLDFTYSLGEENKLQFTLEVRNFTNNDLYDNFSLPKPGRAYYGKVRYIF